MAAKKLSQIVQSLPAAADFLVGVTAGSVDKLFPVSSISGLLDPTTSPNFDGSHLNFYVATTGSDSNTGTLASPFATVQHAADTASKYNYRNPAGGSFGPIIHIEGGTYSNFSAELDELVNGAGGTVSIEGAVTVVVGSMGIGFASTGITASWSYVANTGVSPSLTIDTKGGAAFAVTLANITIQNGTYTVTDSTVSGNSIFFIASQFGTIFVQNQTLNIGPSFAAIGQVSNLNFGLNGNILFEFGTIVFPGSNFGAAGAFFDFRQGGEVNAAIFGGTAPITNASFFQGLSFNCRNSESRFVVDTGLGDIPGTTGLFDQNSGIFAGNTGDFTQFGNQNAGIPTTTQISAGGWGLYKDTSGGGVYLAYNDSGTIKKVALV